MIACLTRSKGLGFATPKPVPSLKGGCHSPIPRDRGRYPADPLTTSSSVDALVPTGKIRSVELTILPPAGEGKNCATAGSVDTAIHVFVSLDTLLRIPVGEMSHSHGISPGGGGAGGLGRRWWPPAC